MHYLDNAATTRPCEEALEIFLKISREEFGNPSSLHGAGLSALRRVSEARDAISSALLCAPREIIFTSGGTESNNIAILGAARALGRKRGRILAGGYEHASAYAAIAALEKDGFEVVFIPAENGVPDVRAFKAAADKNTVLLSLMLVNNETGLISPVAEAARAVKAAAPGCIVHCDAVQAFCKLPFTAAGLEADLISLSGHKIGALKGTGALYVKDGVRLVSPVYGGGHERGLRSGTINAAGIAALGAAAKKAASGIKKNLAYVSELRGYALGRLSELGGRAADAGGAEYSPYILSVSFKGLAGETLLHFLSEIGVYVATAAACSSNKNGDLRVLTAQGVDSARAKSTLRVSFSPDSTKEDIDALAAGIEQAQKKLSKGVRN